VDFNLLNKIKNKDSSWIDFLFYSVCALLAAVVLCYFIFSFKIYLQNQKINEIQNRIAAFGTDEQRKAEKEVLDYKKKIDDFTKIVNNRKISSNIFSFIEANTLSNVWFSNFDMQESDNKIKLSGESENMETFSRQVQVFEKSGDYVKDVSISDSEVQTTGKIKFVLDISLDPKIFTYTSIFLPTTVNPSESSTNNP